LTKFITLISMATLALAVLWGSSPDYAMSVSVLVSGTAIWLAVRSFSVGKALWGLLFLGILGAFTPFHSNQWPQAVMATRDMATLALLGLSPVAFRKSGATAVASVPKGMLR
jgi:hypothetical protein